MTTTRASHIQQPDLSKLQAMCQYTSRAYRAHTISYDVSFRSRVKRSTVPFQRGPPSIFISLSVYTYATTRRCISRYDAAPPAFEKCVSSLSASTAGAHIRLCKHTRTLPSSANTLAVATSASASPHSQPVATQPTIHET